MAVPALAADQSSEDLTKSVIELDAVATAAQNTGQSVNDIVQQLDDGLINLTSTGHVAVRSEKASAPVNPPGAGDQGTDKASGDDTLDAEDMDVPAADRAPLDDTTPAGGSRPGAPVTVYLDFDGEVIENTGWNDEGVDEDGNPTYPAQESYDLGPMGNADAAFQEQVWKIVSEDYAPFNVNVTTTRPSDDALYKTSPDDDEYGSHVVLTDDYPAFGQNSGGIAFRGGLGSQYLSPAFAFSYGVTGGQPENVTPEVIATVASHESGHNFGLQHDGFGDDEYYQPTAGLWGPIMGAAYNSPIVQWSDGDYANATNDEDDLAVMTDRGAAQQIFNWWFDADGNALPDDTTVCVPEGVDPENPQPGDAVNLPNEETGDCTEPLGTEFTAEFEYTDRGDLAADDFGDSTGEAESLDNADGAFEADGVIGQRDDLDVFSFTTNGGDVSVDIATAADAADLDAKVTLSDADGNTVAEGNEETTLDNWPASMDASVSATVDPGTYYVTVDGISTGAEGADAAAAGAPSYSDYASLGRYTLTGQAEPFVIDPIEITSPEEGAEVEGGSEVDVTGTATPGATVTLTADGSDDEVTATADEDGNWTAAFPVNEYGETSITAAQTVAGIDGGNDAVTVVAPVPAPAITSPAEGDVTDENPIIEGTSAPGAEITVHVTDAEGNEQTVTVTADDQGNWSAELESPLAAGAATVEASASLGAVGSETAGPVDFTVEASTDDGNDDGGSDGSGDTGGDTGSGAGDDSGNEGPADTGVSDGSNGDSLAVTGSDFNAAPLGFVALGLLIVGAGTAAFALRQRRLSMKG